MSDPLNLTPPRGSRMFQIHEDDLVDLERTLPQFHDALHTQLTPTLRTQFRRVQDILSNVRWNYGPHENVKVIPFNGGEVGDD